MTQPAMSCSALLARLSDYIDGDLTAPDRVALEKHMASCASCASLATELEAIRRSAARLPSLEPSRDLWDGIASRMDTTVVSIHASRRSSWTRVPWRSLAAAAVLMAATGAVTYTVTTRVTQAEVAQPPVAVSPGAEAMLPDAPPRESLAAIPSTGRPLAPAIPSPRASGATLVSDAPPPSAAVERVYGAEIAELQSVLDAGRGVLDTTTVQLLERNLGIIDQAIEESRAALARDPSSRFLTDQLTSALDQKLRLMRTVALISSRT